MKGHTPGPYTIGPDGRTVGPIRLLSTVDGDVRTLHAVAVVKEQPRPGQADANAALLASAPELFAVLRAITEAYSQLQLEAGVIEDDFLVAAADAVIAKVKGR